MVGTERYCEALLEGGGRCRATPMREVPFCFWHNPETQQEATDARRLGGLRRRREGALEGAYNFDGLGTALGARRLLDIAALDALALENSLGRSRTLAYIAQVSLHALEVGEYAERLAALEAALEPRALQAKRR
jgi:hypothetical protein